MDSGEPRLAGPDLTGGQPTPSSRLLERHTAHAESSPPQPGRRWWAAAAWTAGGLILFALLLRIAFTLEIDSDGANNALQGWDMIHGNLLLHHWIIGDATYYTFDLPVIALAELFLGLHPAVIHIGPAIVFWVVAISAMAVARTNSRGTAAVTRSLVALAVLATAFVSGSSTWVTIAKPDHIGTAAFLLVSFLLIDRRVGWRFAPPLLFLILTAGQVGDALVLYIAVPAIAAVSIYRIIASRTLRSGDSAIALAALLSIPAALLVRIVMVRLGAYAMVSPKVQLAPLKILGHNAYLTGHSIVLMFGALLPTSKPLGPVGFAFGVACMTAAAYGFVRVIWHWRSATRAEQMMCVAIVLNIAAYLFSTLPVPTNPRELAAVVPCGAVLAARALVPARIATLQRARVAITAGAVAALLPLASAATRPVVTPSADRLAAWLEAHHLSYGIAGYWNASDVSVASSDRVEVRAVSPWRNHLAAADWETRSDWYSPSIHRATFVIAGIGKFTNAVIPASVFEKYLGQPTKIYRVGNVQVLLYPYNVLRSVESGPVRPPGLS